MNTIRIMGNLTRDPAIRTTGTGKRVASFSVAVNRMVGDKQVADFINVVAWEALADAVQQNLHKGSRVVVDGRLSIRAYEAQDGSKRQAAEVVASLISVPISGPRAAERGVGDNLYQQNTSVANRGDFMRFGRDEEIPF